MDPKAEVLRERDDEGGDYVYMAEDFENARRLEAKGYTATDPYLYGLTMRRDGSPCVSLGTSGDVGIYARGECDYGLVTSTPAQARALRDALTEILDVVDGVHAEVSARIEIPWNRPEPSRFVCSVDDDHLLPDAEPQGIVPRGAR